MNYTSEDILAYINARRIELEQNSERELSSRDNADFSQSERELYKDKSIKVYKDISRNDYCEENKELPLAPVGEETAEYQEQPKEEELVVAPTTSTSSRDFITGISVQQSIAKSVKIFCNIQFAEDASTGEVYPLTAELKPSHRRNEVSKKYEPDSYEFQQFFSETLKSLKELPAKERKKIYVGRLHKRGIREQWIPDSVMIAYTKTLFVNPQTEYVVVEKIYLNVEGDEFTIHMDETLSPEQSKYYLSSGIYGEVKSSKIAPRLRSIKKIKI
jgi:hypothetical protein